MTFYILHYINTLIIVIDSFTHVKIFLVSIKINYIILLCKVNYFYILNYLFDITRIFKIEILLKAKSYLKMHKLKR